MPAHLDSSTEPSPSPDSTTTPPVVNDNSPTAASKTPVTRAAMEKFLLPNLEPSLKAFDDTKQLACKHNRSTLDADAALHNNIVSSLDKGA
ncbi:unnamed protein product [Trichobilharzia regenti]|nr:unnamed protein product [Trichobilharzia regenti]